MEPVLILATSFLSLLLKDPSPPPQASIPGLRGDEGTGILLKRPWASSTGWHGGGVAAATDIVVTVIEFRSQKLEIIKEKRIEKGKIQLEGWLSG